MVTKSPRKTRSPAVPSPQFTFSLTTSRTDLLKDGSDDWMRDTIYRLVQALGRLVACREAFGRQLGLTGSQFTVLVGVAYRQGPDGIAIAPLAAHIGLAATHVTTEVGRLVRKGLLIKRPNKVDKRSVLIMLSPKGEAAVRAVTPVVRRINDLLLEGISATQLEASSTFANSLLHNSEQAVVALKVIETKPSPKRSGHRH